MKSSRSELETKIVITSLKNGVRAFDLCSCIVDGSREDASFIKAEQHWLLILGLSLIASKRQNMNWLMI